MPNSWDSSSTIHPQLRMAFCGECCLVTDISDPKNVVHLESRLPLCSARTPTARSGPVIEFKFDAELRAKIDASPADPRDRSNWELHPAADGNKGYLVWKPKEK